jgi:hypothetical protein
VRGENVLSQEVIEKIARALKIDPNEIVQSAERTSLDDMPTGVIATPMADGKVWLRVNAEVQPGIHLAVEPLVFHKEPLSNSQLLQILSVLESPVRPVE